MQSKVNLKFFSLILILSSLFSCDKVKDIVNPKTDVEKLHEYINSNEWNIDTISTQTSDANRTVFADNYPPFTSGKVTFSKISEGHGYTKGIMTRIININNKDSTIFTPYLIAEVNYIKLYYTNPNIGFPDVEIIYDIEESSNNKFKFIRDEGLVSSTNGALYGYSRSVFKLRKQQNDLVSISRRY